MLPLFLAKKASGMLSFFRGTAGKSPDLSSQKRETLRGADSAYYQVGQTGKEGAENQGMEPQGVLRPKCLFLALILVAFVPHRLNEVIPTAETRAFPLFSHLSVVAWKRMALGDCSWWQLSLLSLYVW